MSQNEGKLIRGPEVKGVEPVPGIVERWLLNKETPTQDLSLAMVEVGPGKSSGLHRHSVEEAFFILSGQGRARVGDASHELSQHSCLYLTANTPHDIQCTGDEPLRFIIVLTGAQFETEWL